MRGNLVGHTPAAICAVQLEVLLAWRSVACVAAWPYARNVSCLPFCRLKPGADAFLSPKNAGTFVIISHAAMTGEEPSQIACRAFVVHGYALVCCLFCWPGRHRSTRGVWLSGRLPCWDPLCDWLLRLVGAPTEEAIFFPRLASKYHRWHGRSEEKRKANQWYLQLLSYYHSLGT